MFHLHCVVYEGYAHTTLLAIRCEFAPRFVNYKITKKVHSTRSASDKAYQLLAHGRWFSPASSITKTGRHDITEILLKVALNTITKPNNQTTHMYWCTMSPQGCS